MMLLQPQASPLPPIGGSSQAFESFDRSYTGFNGVPMHNVVGMDVGQQVQPQVQVQVHPGMYMQSHHDSNPNAYSSSGAGTGTGGYSQPDTHTFYPMEHVDVSRSASGSRRESRGRSMSRSRSRSREGSGSRSRSRSGSYDGRGRREDEGGDEDEDGNGEEDDDDEDDEMEDDDIPADGQDGNPYRVHQTDDGPQGGTRHHQSVSNGQFSLGRDVLPLQSQSQTQYPQQDGRYTHPHSSHPANESGGLKRKIETDERGPPTRPGTAPAPGLRGDGQHADVTPARKARTASFNNPGQASGANPSHMSSLGAGTAKANSGANSGSGSGSGSGGFRRPAPIGAGVDARGGDRSGKGNGNGNGKDDNNNHGNGNGNGNGNGGGGGGGRDRRDSEGGNGAGQGEGTSQGFNPNRKPTCDICRKRKIKCVRADSPDPQAPPMQCNGCKSIGLECTYLHVYKRPGRPNSWMTGQGGSKRKASDDDRPKEEGGDATRRKSVSGKVGKDANGRSHGKGQSNVNIGHNAQAPSVHFSLPDDKPSHDGRHIMNGNTHLYGTEHRGDYMMNLSHTGESNFHSGSPDLWNSASASPGHRQSHADMTYSNTLNPTGLSVPGVGLGGRMQSFDDYGGNHVSQSYARQTVAPAVGNIIHGVGIGMPGGSGSSNGFVHPANRLSPNGSGNALDVHVMGTNGAMLSGDTTGSYRSNSMSGNQFGIPPGVISASTQPVHLPSEHSGFSPSLSPGSMGANMLANNHNMAPPVSTYQDPPHNHATGSDSTSRGRQDSLRGQQSSIPPAKLLQDSLHTMPQIEDVTSWSTVSFFISLYLRHLHALTPIVHKPNFTVCLATRLDQKDVEFRAFLLSITSYVISQSPKSRMIEHYSQSELEKLQNVCYRASQLLQTRRYKEPNLVQVGTLMCDYFFCTSTGKVARATATMAEAIALSYRMNMHDDARTAASGVDHTETQLRRRTFWHLYAIDKTEASAGQPSMMNDSEGLCSLPLEVDDDFITAQGSFPQPAHRTSTMVGFVAVSKLFKIMSEVLFRHRCVTNRFNLSNQWENDPPPGDPTVTSSSMGMDDMIRRESEWIVRAHDRIREVLDGLPPDLATQRAEVATNPDLPPDMSAIFGMQVANCLITAASVQFALYDFKAFLDAGADTVAESQEQTAREMYRLLSSIPLDHLAANGESMRGKVLRIILALLNRSRTPDQLSEEVKSFWNMFSMIQFVQVMPSTADSVFPSREASPGPVST